MSGPAHGPPAGQREAAAALATRLRPLCAVADGTPGRTLAALLDLAQRGELALYARRAAFDLGWPGAGQRGNVHHFAPPTAPVWRTNSHRLLWPGALGGRQVWFDPDRNQPLRLDEWPGDLSALADGDRALASGRCVVSITRAMAPEWSVMLATPPWRVHLFHSADEKKIVTEATPRAALGPASLLVDVDELDRLAGAGPVDDEASDPTVDRAAEKAAIFRSMAAEELDDPLVWRGATPNQSELARRVAGRLADPDDANAADVARAAALRGDESNLRESAAGRLEARGASEERIRRILADQIRLEGWTAEELDKRPKQSERGRRVKRR